MTLRNAVKIRSPIHTHMTLHTAVNIRPHMILNSIIKLRNVSHHKAEQFTDFMLSGSLMIF